MLLLRERQGDQKPKEIEVPLEGTHITFGRGEDCTYRFTGSGSVSRVQATLQKIEGIWAIIDGSTFRASSNGIFLDGGRRVNRHELSSGDEITLFNDGIYIVTLSVIDTKEEPIKDSTEETIEVPLYRVQDEIALLRNSLQSAVEKLADLAKAIEESSANALKALEINGRQTVTIDAIQQEIVEVIKPQFNALKLRDRAQDKITGRILIALSGVMIALGSYEFSGGKPEAMDRVLGIVQIILGGGTVTTMAMRKDSSELDR